MSNRKAFSFYLSYYEVYCKLTTDKDKLSFINALLDKQFKGIEPKKLTPMAEFGYISQREAINKQVKGWEDKTGNKLSYPCQGGVATPSQQEKEKEKEKEKEEYNSAEVKTSTPQLDYKKLLEYINLKTLRTGNNKFRVINNSVKSKYKARLKDGYTNKDIFNAINNAVEDKYHKETNYKYLTPEFFSRSAILDKHGYKTKADVNKVPKDKFISNAYHED